MLSCLCSIPHAAAPRRPRPCGRPCRPINANQFPVATSHLGSAQTASCDETMSPSYSNYGASTSSPWMNGSPVGAAAVRTAGSSRRSSRDKGKQRARYEEEVGDDHHDGDGQSAAAQLGGAYKVDSVGGMPFNIRFTDGTTEDLLDLFVNESETVREVKRRVGWTGHLIIPHSIRNSPRLLRC